MFGHIFISLVIYIVTEPEDSCRNPTSVCLNPMSKMAVLDAQGRCSKFHSLGKSPSSPRTSKQ